MKIFLLSLLVLNISCTNMPNKIRSIASENDVNNNQAEMPLQLEVKRNYYLGNKTFEIKLGLSNSKGVKQLILDNKNRSYDSCYEKLPRVVLTGDLTFTRKFKMLENKGDNCDYKRNDIVFDTIIVIFENGEIETLKPFDFYYPDQITKSRSSFTNKKINKINIEESLLKEEKGRVQSGIGNTVLETKKQTYEISYNVSASDLTDYRGIIFNDGEEFLSEDPKELADFINNKKSQFKLEWVQDMKVTTWPLCNFQLDCLTTAKPIKDKFKLKDGFKFLEVKLINKEEITQTVIDYKVYSND